MINEILTIGVSMDIAVTVIWFVAYILVPKFKKQGAIA